MGDKEFKKNDSSKPCFELLPIDLLYETNLVLRHGAQKYGINNWKKKEGFKYSRCYNALLRHMMAWWSGENLDPETKYSHLAHAMCNLLFLTYHYLNNVQGDDRPKEGQYK